MLSKYFKPTLSEFYVNYSLLIISIGIASRILVLGITMYYFVSFDAIDGMVFGCCKGLSWPFPTSGIAWGDISTAREYRAGFAENLSPLTVGAIYPSAGGSERYI